MNTLMYLMFSRNPGMIKQMIMAKAPTYLKKTKEKKNKQKKDKKG